jgi:hypothetical protein
MMGGRRVPYRIGDVHGAPSKFGRRVPFPTKSYLYYQISHVQKVNSSTFLMLLRNFLNFRKFAYG